MLLPAFTTRKEKVICMMNFVFDVFLITFLGFILGIAKGVHVGLFFFLISVLIYKFLKVNLKKPRIVIMSLLCIIAFMQSTSIPKGSFVYADNGNVTYLTESSFISPFAHAKPSTQGPDPENGFILVKNVPKHLFVQIEYTIQDPSTLTIENWLKLQEIVKNGVEIPVNIFENHANEQKFIEEYLHKTYPFFTTTATVRNRG